MDSITLEFTHDEQKALLAIFDVSLKAAGLGALEAVAHFKAKLDEARQSIAARRNHAMETTESRRLTEGQERGSAAPL